MSAIGTVIASGVVPATQQASQVANRRDKRVREQQRAAQRTRQVFETHLQTLEENDETETSARLRPDAQMHTTPHGPNPPGLELARVYRRAKRDADANNAQPATGSADAGQSAEARHPAYDQAGHRRPADPGDDSHPHIDVQG